MAIETEVLYALYSLYQKNLITYEQKGMIKDMLIQNDFVLRASIANCETQCLLQHRILELLKGFQMVFIHLDQESPRNSTCISPLKRMPSCSTTHSRQRIKSAIQNPNQKKTISRQRSNSLTAI
ncbi:unnamed protein product (macronuclear) [Paramecium tetraurelia]|uniref:Uncharacterized protein n=1 Tax=Paramecium tetraurelia TaxID=5888 RepID=A0E9T4_PARTE|nr:uncharacterized protein GSPATT00024782001 [Paramecium tetraurelia]CAK92051.1 unnamed protein product [Paramecium tetraurelia]|eukprot:XP_001459448.1 hypothetical protein (macronuclear) [Paramecium tetraurelia strain d4-2]